MANRTLYHGDNLKFLRGINTGTMNLIYADPPFNKNKDFHATPDSIAAGAKFTDRWRWDSDVHPEWVDAIQDDWPGVWQVIEAARIASGDDMAAFLCWLGVRLLEMHRVLTDEGSLYLHIDHTAHAWTKALLDGIFGNAAFRREVVWQMKSRSGFKSQTRNWVRDHDTLLYYIKGRNTTFNRQFEPYSEDYISKMFKGRDKDGRRYRQRGNRRYYEDESGIPFGDVWTDISSFQTATRSKEFVGYPTQKPLALLERIIKASSNEGDVVLDPFVGCATTPIAAERLGRQWIGMDIWKGAHEIVLQRLESEGLATPDSTDTQLLTFGDVHYSTAPPVRSDDNAVASKALNLKVQIPEPPGKKMSRAEMMGVLIQNNGLCCRGCNRWFDDPLYLELDHNTPRSDGGLNHISNRVLLCGPCNRIKSNTLTLSGLRKKNKKLGRMGK